ncbi:MAG: hypothetical protein HKN43_17410 [Rhodothermales bacterium]|nr:hypothetical protein [Rhodothermales bacterium]
MRSRQLIITNGSSAAELIESVVEDADLLSWDDVLHDGPVPDLHLESLSRVRADFIASCGWGSSSDSVYRQFVTRDETILKHAEYGEVVLFFEHDLYDQLQLCQILDVISSTGIGETNLSAVLMSDYIAEQEPGIIDQKLESRTAVTESQLDTAVQFWRNFTSKDHRGLATVDCSSFPHLPAARTRLLEEYPSVTNGLGRSRNSILQILAGEVLNPVALFSNHQALETARYLGDSSFWRYIEGLLMCSTPLVRSEPDFFRPGRRSGFKTLRLSLTDAGRGVAAGEIDNLELNDIDEWIGGVHLTGPDAPRWDGFDLVTK